ncbi:hypothetical protein HK102_001117 [Quaeritorhiza haematococci]|nr:hypothetical protein HK102_001117 [Quaeritorhiza haematococci]
MVGKQPVIEYEEDEGGMDVPLWTPKPMPARMMMARWVGKQRWKLPWIPDHHIDRRPEMPQEERTVHLIKCLWGRKATLRQIEAVYNTGATGNLISRREWMKLPKKEHVEWRYDGPPLAGIGNGTIEPKAMARIAIVMGGARRTIDVGIAEDEDFPVLLGTDFIDRYVAHHNVKDGWLQLIGEKKRIPVKTFENESERGPNTVVVLAITSQSTVKRDHAQFLTVRTVVKPPKLACVEFGMTPLVTGALVESGVIGEDQWKKVGCSYWTTQVFIRNLLPRHLHLRVGQVVGKVYEIEDGDVDLIDCTPSDEAAAKQKNTEVIVVDAEDGDDAMAGQKTPSVEEQAEAFLAETLGQAGAEKGKVAVAEKGGNGVKAKRATVNRVLLVGKNVDDARRDTAAHSKGAAQSMLHIQQPIAEDVATAIRKSAEVEARVREDADPRAKFFDETLPALKFVDFTPRLLSNEDMEFCEKIKIPKALTGEQAWKIKCVVMHWGKLGGIAANTGAPGATKIAKHSINNQGKPPPQLGAYRRSAKEREVVRKCLEQMLWDGIVQPSVSAYASPVVITWKKDGGPRFNIVINS